VTEFPIKNCLNCNSAKLSFKKISLQIEQGFFEGLLPGDKFKKLAKFTCKDCGFVMFFDPEYLKLP